MRSVLLACLSALGVCFVFVSAAEATDWPQLRGPSFNGASDETGLPSKFSQNDNVKWRVEVPGPSAATPIISNGKVFITCADKANETLSALCYDEKTGELVWQRTVAKGISQDTRSNYASPTPASDGELVVFFFGNGNLVTFTHSGEELWRKNLGPFAFQWTFSTSPLLYDGKLYMQVLQRDKPVNGNAHPGGNDSYLLALDPKSGRQIFRENRESKAVEESLEAFTTPMPYQIDGRDEIIIAGGDALSGHDPDTGKELWRWGTWNPGRIPHWRLVPSPVAGNGVVLACAPKRDPIYALKAGGKGVLSDNSLVWVSREKREVSSDVPTPAYHDGDFLILSDVQRTLSRVDSQTGSVKWMTPTPGRSKYEASPTVADGKIYLINFDGEATVVDADSGKILHTAPMEPKTGTEDFVRATITVANGNVFIRTNTRLYCVGE